MPKTQNLDSNLLINRELSQLRFNARVLALAIDSKVPLLERLRFLFICSSNLDEFFEIRVAGLKEQREFERQKSSPDGLSSQTLLEQISHEAHALSIKIYDLLNHKLIPELKQHNIDIITHQKWSPNLTKWLKNYFDNEVIPVLSPIALDIAHPLPRLINKSLNFIVSLTGKDAFGRDSGIAVVHVPRSLPRMIRLPKEFAKNKERFILITAIFSRFVDKLFPGMKINGCYQFRLTRNSDLLVEDSTSDDLAHVIKNKLLRRNFGSVARLEIAADCPQEISDFLLRKHGLSQLDMYHCAGPVNLHRYITIIDELNRPELCYPKFTPEMPKELLDSKNIFNLLQEQDVLLQHPYQAFSIVVDFVMQAAADPDVLAIKQTLYRTRTDSRMVQALMQAALAGKTVTAIIELRARFDEYANIELANRLQKAGVLVVYGVIGIKTHAKMILVVRREGNRLCRYAHLGTGNYHEHTALQYTDLGLLTYDKEITRDVQSVFQQLTGMGRASKLKKLLHSPFTFYKTLIALIKFEADQAKAGKKGKIIIKVNGLTDPGVINALYKASQAGVQIDLIVRTCCSLRPGIKDLSDNIRVRSIVGRFLEHSRIYYFYHAGEHNTYCSSADLMERNIRHRVEVCFPIENPKLARRIVDDYLLAYLQDNTDSWHLQGDGSYIKNKASKAKLLSAQSYFLKKYS